MPGLSGWWKEFCFGRATGLDLLGKIRVNYFPGSWDETAGAGHKGVKQLARLMPAKRESAAYCSINMNLTGVDAKGHFMDTAERSQTAVKGKNQPEETGAVQVIEAAPPMPVIKPPDIWTPPATVPGHDTEIRHWGINE